MPEHLAHQWTTSMTLHANSGNTWSTFSHNLLLKIQTFPWTSTHHLVYYISLITSSANHRKAILLQSKWTFKPLKLCNKKLDCIFYPSILSLTTKVTVSTPVIKASTNSTWRALTARGSAGWNDIYIDWRESDLIWMSFFDSHRNNFEPDIWIPNWNAV